MLPSTSLKEARADPLFQKASTLETDPCRGSGALRPGQRPSASGQLDHDTLGEVVPRFRNRPGVRQFSSKLLKLSFTGENQSRKYWLMHLLVALCSNRGSGIESIAAWASDRNRIAGGCRRGDAAAWDELFDRHYAGGTLRHGNLGVILHRRCRGICRTYSCR